MSVTLPNPGMNFVPLEVLTAENQNKIVENVEFLASKIQDSTNAYVTNRLAIYIDGTNGNDNNSGTTAQTAKKTLQSALDLLNTLGGSIDFKFVTAGNYTAHGGFFDAANILFEKNSSSVGATTINFTSEAKFDNSVLEINNITLAGSTVSMYNSHLRLTRSASTAYQGVECEMALYGTQAQATSITWKKPCTLSNGSTANLAGCTIAPEFSSGIPMRGGASSSIVINTSLTMEEPTTAGLTALFSVSAGGNLIFQDTPTITNNVSANKYTRIIAASCAFVSAASATRTAMRTAATSDDSLSRTVLIRGAATLG